MNLSVIIPNYNGEEILQKNLPKILDSLVHYEKGEIEVIVPDDASTDKSLRVLEDFKKKISATYPKIKFTIVNNHKNCGFSSNVNSGVRRANGDILILLNTDVIPGKNFLVPLLSHFSDPNIFAVGCMDESAEKDKRIFRGRGIGLWRKGFLIHSRGDINKTNTLWVSGGSGAFRKSIWNKLGGLNSLYDPFYWEDIDLSYRALKSGYQILFDPESLVVHEHEKGAIKKKFTASQVKSIAYRNQFIFVWKNVTDFDITFSHLLWLPYHFAKAILRRDLEFFKGFFSAFLLFPVVIKYRLQDQKLFTKKDKEVISEFIK
ncbi:MAG: glycosyltransferase family 2 protein [Candidatus Levybacteria bacterium]|nr:glycosyltransferase family 2 protein [Candidatus Levybacteria bacterium]